MKGSRPYLLVGVSEEPSEVLHSAGGQHGARAILYAAREAPRRGGRLHERRRRGSGLCQRRHDRRHGA